MKSWGRKSLKKFMGAGKVQKYEMVAFLPECLERQSFLRRLVLTYTFSKKVQKSFRKHARDLFPESKLASRTFFPKTVVIRALLPKEASR